MSELVEYHSIAALVKQAEAEGRLISALVLEDQAAALEQRPEELVRKMRETLEVMRRAAEKGAVQELRSTSGLSGGDGFRMAAYAEGNPLSGAFCAQAIVRALAIAEYNAAMGKIVAAPTAGSCGILPAAVLTMMDQRGLGEDAAVMALFTAGAFGMVIAKEASIAGAEGGCQAECGSAAAISAAALVELSGGSPAMAAEACAMALKNQLGLVCDPVAGLVESPCIKRNAGGVMCAIGAAEMALAGIRSLIPVDEVIAAMAEVGRSLPESLRETSRGGLAATPTALALKQKLFG
ncbi:MAG: L-serine ammonia-lyase, iron-sulfur-dependent, subunit alpha [Treponema sp.]|jgi:L-serine dehydratase|nr:L-serine ammonia-lyase, iron-sulfur-dependent, subunit alpha [Treponema sp.]